LILREVILPSFGFSLPEQSLLLIYSFIKWSILQIRCCKSSELIPIFMNQYPISLTLWLHSNRYEIIYYQSYGCFFLHYAQQVSMWTCLYCSPSIPPTPTVLEVHCIWLEKWVGEGQDYFWPVIV
jgi:hypothetical protein